MKQKSSKLSVTITDRITRDEFSKMSGAVNDLLARGFSLEDIACDCGMSGGWWSHVKSGNGSYLKIKATYL